MARPPIGAEIKTTEGMTAKVLKELGSGGQGTVYMVDYGGKKMALKWYHDSAFADPKTGAVDAEKRESFYENLKNNVRIGSPSAEFLWPLAITGYEHGSFGYIMELRPDRFVQESTLLVGRRVHFESYSVVVQAMLGGYFVFGSALANADLESLDFAAADITRMKVFCAVYILAAIYCYIIAFPFDELFQYRRGWFCRVKAVIGDLVGDIWMALMSMPMGVAFTLVAGAADEVGHAVRRIVRRFT